MTEDAPETAPPPEQVELEERAEKQLALLKQQIAQRREAEEALQRARQRAEALRNANLALTRTLDPDTVLSTFLDYLEQLIGYDTAAFLLVEGPARLRLKALRGYEGGAFLDSVLNPAD